MMPIDESEQLVRALQEKLAHEAPIPLGLIARLEANVAGAIHAHDAHIAWEARVVVACIAFVVIGFGSADLLTPGTALTLLACVALYSWKAVPSLNRLPAELIVALL